MDVRLFITVATRRGHEELSNSEIYEIRKRIAQMYQDTEFGEIIELEEGKFANTFMVPDTDQYYRPENELFLSFTFRHPFTHGQGNHNTLMWQGIPDFLTWVGDNYAHLCAIIRFEYLN